MRLKMMTGGGNIDYDSLTAMPRYVMEGRTFFGSGSDEEQTGELPDKSKMGESPGVSEDEPTVPIHYASPIITKDTTKQNRIAMCPDWGCYPGNGKAYIGCIPEELGITREIIANGAAIAGIKGSYGSDSVFTEEDLREGKVAYGKNGRIEGTAKDYGTIIKTLAAGEMYEAKKGFHSNVKIAAKDLSSQTQGSLDAKKMVSGVNGYSNGKKISGTMNDRGAYAYASGMGEGNDGVHSSGYYAFNNMPEGWYHETSGTEGWSPEVRLDRDTVRKHLGITAGKIISGQSIAGIFGNQHPYAYTYGNVNSDGSVAFRDGANYYMCRFNLPFEPMVGYVIHYHSNRLRDITVFAPNNLGAKFARMMNFNQARMGGSYSYGFAQDENGAWCGKGDCRIPVVYGGSAYQYFFAGYY